MDVKEILLQFFRKRKREELVGMRYFVRSNKAHICRVDAEQELDCIRKKIRDRIPIYNRGSMVWKI